MGRQYSKSVIAIGVSVFLMALTLGCARQLLPQTGEDSPSRQPVPFERSADTRGISPTVAFTPVEIPVGTPVTVHLQGSLSSASSHAGDSFDAVLDEPIIVKGQSIAPQGAAITGKVLDAKASAQPKDPGYLRLVLTAVSLNGKLASLQTSSIFAKGGPRKRNQPGLDLPLASTQQDVRYDTQQRLTFRLTQPLPLRD